MVPITLVLDDEVRGCLQRQRRGKIISIKTVGLFGLLNRSVYMPAKRGQLSATRWYLTDIGDEQSIDDELSTFSGHMKQIAKILKVQDLPLFSSMSWVRNRPSRILCPCPINGIRPKSLPPHMVTSHHTHLKQFAYAARGDQRIDGL